MNDNGKRPGANARRKATPVTPAAADLFTPEERRLARYARTCYVVNRSAFQSAKEGGTDLRWKVPRSYDGVVKPSNDPQDANKKPRNVWYMMGRWFHQHQIDPPAFIQYVFARLDIAARIPEPLQVCDERHLANFRKYVTEHESEVIAKAWEVQSLTAQMEMKACRDAFGAIDPARAVGMKFACVANVILNESIPLSPLFRYLLALSSARDAGREGDEEAKSRFLDFARRLYDKAAIHFYAHRIAYAKHWARWLPKRFPAEAEARVRQLAFNEEVGDEDAVV